MGWAYTKTKIMRMPLEYVAAIIHHCSYDTSEDTNHQFCTQNESGADKTTGKNTHEQNKHSTCCLRAY